MPKRFDSPNHAESGVNKKLYVRSILLRLLLVAFDIFAVNVSVFLAMITRFYVANQFHSVAAHHFATYGQYAPVYTLFCLVVFAAFRLYSGMWKYAGFNDLNRIAAANVITFIGHVVGTIAFSYRMPISVYCISALAQLCLIGGSRFIYRILRVERERIMGVGKATVNALIVGIGGTARTAVKQLEHESVVRPVCMLNFKEAGMNSLFDGIPVVNGVENLKSAIEKYHVNLVVFASAAIPEQVRTQIQDICREQNVEAQDFTGFFQKAGNSVTLRSFAECASGPVELAVNGQYKSYDDCEQAMMAIGGRYIVKSVSAKGNTLVVELADNGVVPNDLNADWVKDQEKETGEEISFF